MKRRLITEKQIAGFKEHLILEERSPATIEKYIRDARSFAAYAGGEITKEIAIAYGRMLPFCHRQDAACLPG